MQEVAHGSDALILWADLDIPWLSLSRADKWYTLRVGLMADMPDCRYWILPFLLGQPYSHQLPSEVETFQYKRVEDLDILNVINVARGVKLSDARDRIYAFMTLPFVRKPVPTLQPDYEQSPMEIYRRFAVEYLRLAGALNILLYVHHKDQVSEDTAWSSWVPDWASGTTFSAPSASAQGTLIGFGNSTTNLHRFAIVDEEEASLPCLQVRAVIFDSIRLASTRLDRDCTIEDVIAIWEQIKELKWIASDGREFDVAVGLRFLKSFSNGGWHGSSSEHWAKLLKMYATFLDNADAPESDIAKNLHIPMSLATCHQALIRRIGDSTQFISDRGYFGLGSKAIMEGDVVAFVFGVAKPLILRGVSGAEPDHYKVVGATYLVSHQLDMYGLPMTFDALDNWDDWDRLCKGQGWEPLDLKAHDIILE